MYIINMARSSAEVTNLTKCRKRLSKAQALEALFDDDEGKFIYIDYNDLNV